MELAKYIENKKKFYEVLINFLQGDDEGEYNFKKLIQEVNHQKYSENREEFRLLLHLIVKIIDNYHRSNSIIERIEKFILFLSQDIIGCFSNTEIFHIFCKNKLLLLLLLTNHIIKFDESIVCSLKTEKKIQKRQLSSFFLSRSQAIHQQ